MADKFDGPDVDTLTGGSEVDRLHTVIRDMNSKWWGIAKERNALAAENYQLSADLARVTTERDELLAIAGRNVCRHETRHRGGTIWTICADCGRHWADDEGGFEQGLDAKRLEEIEGKL